MSVTEPGLQRLRMSWEEYLALPEKPRAEWVDGEVVVSPPAGPAHGMAAVRLGSLLETALPHLFVMTEVGLRLPGNRLRAPDLMVIDSLPDERWVVEPPVLVVEVLSTSTRAEDTVRKSAEYAAGGIAQFWVVDPDHRTVDVFDHVEGGWGPAVVALDDAHPRGEVVVGGHGTVGVDLRELLPG